MKDRNFFFGCGEVMSLKEKFRTIRLLLSKEVSEAEGSVNKES